MIQSRDDAVEKIRKGLNEIHEGLGYIHTTNHTTTRREAIIGIKKGLLYFRGQSSRVLDSNELFVELIHSKCRKAENLTPGAVHYVLNALFDAIDEELKPK